MFPTTGDLHRQSSSLDRQLIRPKPDPTIEHVVVVLKAPPSVTFIAGLGRGNMRNMASFAPHEPGSWTAADQILGEDAECLLRGSCATLELNIGSPICRPPNWDFQQAGKRR